MEDGQPSTNPYEVHPTGPESKFSDTALTNLFNVHVTMLLHEERLVWQRYSVFIVAHAIIFGFLSRTTTPQSLTTILAALFGIVLCGMWLIFIMS